MLRVNSSRTLVVPPWECAWLSDEALQLEAAQGCICFEVKGETDVTIILKSRAGSKRLQPAVRHAALPEHAEALPQQQGHQHLVDCNYTIILGSHRNSCLKIERNGQAVHRAQNVPGSRVQPGNWMRFWINYSAGSFTMGTGAPGDGPCHCWADADPLPGIQHVGLSTWDRHVAYRHIHKQPALQGLHHGATPMNLVSGMGSSVPMLCELCVAALTRDLAADSVCSVLLMAELLAGAVDELRPPCMQLLAAQLDGVVAQDAAGFCRLSLGCMLELLRSPDLDCRSEASVFAALMCWACNGAAIEAGQLTQPLDDVEALLPHIRFPLMSQKELQAIAAQHVAQQSPVLRELLREALSSREECENMSPNEQVQLPKTPVCVEGKRFLRAVADLDSHSRFQRRRSPGCQELMYVCDGDHNGVCHFLGTAEGREQWVNPVLAGRLKVCASSPVCRTTDPRALVSGTFLRNSFAGPRMAGGRAEAWWSLALGAKQRLVINYYTLRHDGSTDYMRNWVLEGSNDSDGQSWTVLRGHVNDTTLHLAGQYASWPIAGAAAAVPYAAFRVRSTGPNASPCGRKIHICLSHMELYGYLLRPAAGADGQAAAA